MWKYSWIKTFIFFILILVTFNCQKDTVPFIEIVAKVGDDYLTRDQLTNWLPPDIPEDQRDVLARQYIDRWVERTTLAMKARDEGIALSSYERWSIQNVENEMLAQKYLENKLPQEIIITDEEISTYYQKNKDEYIRNRDEAHIIQLFLENQDRAIAREIRESKALLEVIEKNYLDSQNTRLFEKNGDMGYVPIENLRDEISRLARNGRTGRIYGPIRIESGYYYFQMLDKQKAGSYQSLDLVKADIRLRLINIKRKKLAEELARKMVEKYAVEIYSEHIK